MILRVILSAVLIFGSLPVLTSAATIDPTDKYAWGNVLGWINFAPANGNVLVTDSAITGYAWSQNFGWINLSPSESGVVNDGAGDLSGSAWGEGVGYINFDGVSISTTTGLFSGSATTTSFGSITFDCTNCRVVTDWRPPTSVVTTSTPAQSTGGGSISFPAPSIPAAPSIPITPSTPSEISRIAELRQMILSLESQIKALMGSPAPALSCRFDRSLRTGDIAPEVKELQIFLNSKGFKLADSGPGSPGYETEKFGALTRAAVSRFQRAHGISPDAGYFGPLTRVKMQEVCK